MTTPDPDISLVILLPETPIFEALEALNDAHRRIVLIVDKTERLVGLVTDSNFRRAMLDGVDFANSVDEIMTARPVTVAPDYRASDVLRLMQQTHCHEIPVVTEDGHIVDLLSIEGLMAQDHEPYAAVVLAGGLGERLRPMTDTVPKPLLTVGHQPILFTILDHLIKSRCRPIHLLLNYKSEDIIEAVSKESRFADKVAFVEETERLGTAGPLSLLGERPTRPFVVINGDVLTSVSVSDMARFHREERNSLTIAAKEERFQIPLGVTELEGTRVRGIVEKPIYTHYINAGVYIMEPEVLDLIPTGQRYDMNELIGKVLQGNKRVGCFPVHEYWLDIGYPDQLERANADVPFVLTQMKKN